MTRNLFAGASLGDAWRWEGGSRGEAVTITRGVPCQGVRASGFMGVTGIRIRHVYGNAYVMVNIQKISVYSVVCSEVFFLFFFFSLLPIVAECMIILDIQGCP